MNVTEKSSLWLSSAAEAPLLPQNSVSGNTLSLSFLSRGENVSIARVLTAALLSARQMTLAELDEIKVAVSEAVSNAIIHGYQGQPDSWVEVSWQLADDELTVTVHDEGVGIENIEEAMRPHYSTDQERMGLGFAFMRSFMDELSVSSVPLCGTTVIMSKKLAAR